MTAEDAAQGFVKVAQQMPTIGHLHCRRAGVDSIGIGARTITATINTPGFAFSQAVIIAACRGTKPSRRCQ